MKKTIDIYDTIYTIHENQFCSGEIISKYDDHGDVIYEFQVTKPEAMIGQLITVKGNKYLFFNLHDLAGYLTDEMWDIK